MISCEYYKKPIDMVLGEIIANAENGISFLPYTTETEEKVMVPIGTGDLVDEYLKLDLEQKQITDKKTHIFNQLKEIMTGLDNVVINNHKLYWKVISRTDLDRDRIQNLLGKEVYGTCVKQSSYHRLEIK